MKSRHVLLVLVMVGCDGSFEAVGRDGGGLPDSGAEDASSDARPDGGDGAATDAALDADTFDGAVAGNTPVVALPAAAAEVLYSAALRIRAPAGTDRVRVREPASGSECIARAPGFECLLDLATAPVGALSLSLAALRADGSTIGSSSHALTRRSMPVPCTGDGSALTSCVIARAMAGTSAGFSGVSYLNADDAHANVNTSSMTGIDARVLQQPPNPIPSDVQLGLMNESRAYTSGGNCSLLRCYPSSRQRAGLAAFDANVLYFVPEHRDHGIRDYYQWQAPFFFLSQGSSGSERDEVTKGLRALAILSSETRSAAASGNLIGPLAYFLMTRSRQTNDPAYLSPAAHPTAHGNLNNGERILTLAAAIRPGEVPPVGKVAIENTEFPSAWMMAPALATPYAAGFAPVTNPTSTPSGSFRIEVDLSVSEDLNGRPLLFFPSVLRDSGGGVRVTRLSGSRWRIEGDHPVDSQLMTGGHERTVSRITVGFFPHNGMWLGSPAMVSVGARDADETAPGSNNLD